MKKVYLTIVALASNSLAFSTTYTDQNILVTRSPGKDMYLKELAWHEVKRDAENCRNCLFASTFQLNFFYQRITNKSDVAKYFGILGKGSGISYGPGSGAVSVYDINSEHFIHDGIRDNFSFTHPDYPNTIFKYQKPTNINPFGQVVSVVNGSILIDPLTNLPANGPYPNNSTNLKVALEKFGELADSRAMKGTIDLQTDRRVWGAILSYYAYSASGFWFELNLPILQIKNKLIPVLKEEQSLLDPELSRDVSMTDLICGNYELSENLVGENNDNPNSQTALMYSKFSTSELEKSGLGDLDLTFGYRLVNKKSFDLDGFIKISIPTAEEICPGHTFSPQLGNNGHPMISLGTLFSSDIWKPNGWTIEVIANQTISYSFSRKQNRTLAANLDIGTSLPWDKYILIKEAEVYGPLNPSANILTTKVCVSPGFNSESMICLSARGYSFVGTAGVSIFARQGENVELKNFEKSDQYSKPSVHEYRTTEEITSSSASFNNLDFFPISKQKITTRPASTPGSVSANFFAQIGYFDQDSTLKPFNASIGISYEACNDNSAFNSLTFWVKAGIAF